MKYIYLLIAAIVFLCCNIALAEDVCEAGTAGCINITYEEVAEPINTNITSNETVLTSIETEDSNIVYVRKIDQGACVQLNETINVAGLGWYTGTIAYYGKYYRGYANGDNLSVVSMYHPTAVELRHLFIDPDFFGSKLGYWYTYYNGISSSNANDRLFMVSDKSCFPPKVNASLVSLALNESQNISMIRANLTSLPFRDEGTDLILDKEMDTAMDAPANNSHYWIFGDMASDSLFDLPLVNNVTASYSKDILRKTKAGTYSVVFVAPGQNGIIEARYDPKDKSLYSPFKGVQNKPVNGLQPSMVRDALYNFVQQTMDDTITEIKVSVQDPMIEIVGLDQNTLISNRTLFTITGYTNANAGSKIYVTIDKDKPGSKPTVAEVVNNGGQNAYRTWNVSFIYDFNTMAPKEHSVTATGEDGAPPATVTFFVRSASAEHYKEDVKLSYIENNPFIPTPTPEIRIQKEVQVVVTIQTVLVPVTPSQESVNAAWWNGMIGFVIYACGIIFTGLLAGYVLVAWLRWRKK